jgi:hypothetical protein
MGDYIDPANAALVAAVSVSKDKGGSRKQTLQDKLLEMPTMESSRPVPFLRGDADKPSKDVIVFEDDSPVPKP